MGQAGDEGFECPGGSGSRRRRCSDSRRGKDMAVLDVGEINGISEFVTGGDVGDAVEFVEFGSFRGLDVILGVVGSSDTFKEEGKE